MISHFARIFASASMLCAVPAFAGTLAGDGSSLEGTWHGTSSFQGYLTDGITPTGLTGTLDYAVYTAAQFNADFPGSGYTPTSTYVYTYQAFETGPAPLSSVSVNLIFPYPAQDIGTFQGTDTSPLSDLGTVAGQVPTPGTDFLVPGDSANWPFGGVLVFQGGSTGGLAFSSPNAPQWSTGSTIDDGSVGAVSRIPTPGPSTSATAPEPSSIALASLGFATLAAWGWRRRKRSD